MLSSNHDIAVDCSDVGPLPSYRAQMPHHTAVAQQPTATTSRTLLVFFSFGGGMSRIRRIACSGGSLKKGGSPSTISITMIPVTRRHRGVSMGGVI